MAQQSTPCRCWGCRRELGTTDGEHLFLNDRVSIRRPITLWCVCGGATYWRPSKQGACARAEVLAADGILTP